MFLHARDPFFYRCTVHSLKPAPAPSPAPVISLTGSVGSGGRNLRPDVLQIQAALNGVDPADGGPAQKLVVDGICGPLTIAAIGKFQRHVLTWADFRIDPNGPTLAALNARLSDSTVSRSSVPGSSVSLAFSLSAAVSAAAPPPDPAVQRVLDHVDVIRGALFLARSRIESVAPFVTATGLVRPSGSGSERDQFNLDLVDEIFRLSDFVNPTGDYQELRFQFDGMLQTLRTCDPSKGVNNGLFLRNQSPFMETAAGAYCARSGKFAIDQFSTVPEDGTVVSTKRIYICGNIGNARGRREIIDGISHELAHFVSAPGFSVVDTRDGHSSRDEPRFRDGVYNRISNAENYAWFTWRSFEGKFTF